MASTTVPFLTVMDTSQIVAKAHIPQNDALVLHKGDKATLELSGLDDKIPGTVTLVSPALDPNSTTVEIWVQAAKPQPTVAARHDGAGFPLRRRPSMMPWWFRHHRC